MPSRRSRASQDWPWSEPPSPLTHGMVPAVAPEKTLEKTGPWQPFEEETSDRIEKAYQAYREQRGEGQDPTIALGVPDPTSGGG